MRLITGLILGLALPLVAQAANEQVCSGPAVCCKPQAPFVATLSGRLHAVKDTDGTVIGWLLTEVELPLLGPPVFEDFKTVHRADLEQSGCASLKSHYVDPHKLGLFTHHGKDVTLQLQAVDHAQLGHLWNAVEVSEKALPLSEDLVTVRGKLEVRESGLGAYWQQRAVLTNVVVELGYIPRRYHDGQRVTMMGTLKMRDKGPSLSTLAELWPVRTEL